jgi:hypothetical protein
MISPRTIIAALALFIPVHAALAIPEPSFSLKALANP